jgi:hydrogenase nickel incorporation protein HypB
VQVNSKRGLPARAVDLHTALGRLRTRDLDLLLIEDVSSLVGDFHKAGQHATVGMFSVATGDDKPEKYFILRRLSRAVRRLLHVPGWLPAL